MKFQSGSALKDLTEPSPQKHPSNSGGCRTWGARATQQGEGASGPVWEKVRWRWVEILEKRGQEGASSPEDLCRPVRRQAPPEAGLQGTGLLSRETSPGPGHRPQDLTPEWGSAGWDRQALWPRELDQVGASHPGKLQTCVEMARLEIPLSFL